MDSHIVFRRACVQRGHLHKVYLNSKRLNAYHNFHIFFIVLWGRSSYFTLKTVSNNLYNIDYLENMMYYKTELFLYYIIYWDTHIQTDRQTDRQTHTHTHTHTHTYIHAYIHTHTYIRTYVYTYIFWRELGTLLFHTRLYWKLFQSKEIEDFITDEILLGI